MTCGNNNSSFFFQDIKNGFLLNGNKQVEDIFKQLANGLVLKDGFNAFGCCQGGQFLYVDCPVIAW